jgi:tripartite-type tricarboxylate transporter receptor subunit TctC
MTFLKLKNLICGFLVFLSASAFSAEYPNKPIHLIVPFPPGGPADILARIIGPRLSQSLGQPIIIENRPGAGGNIASEYVAKAKPDGYNLVLGFVGTHAINSSLYANMPYDNVKDFAPVTPIASVSIMLVVHPSIPASSIGQLIEQAKLNPGKLTYGSPGNGTPQHLAGELFETMANVDMVHVPYKGAVPALTDLLGGHLSMIFSSLPPALPHVNNGKLRGIAVTSLARTPIAPSIPTISESGLKGFEVVNWYGVLAPARTPKNIISRLNTEIVKIMNMPEVVKMLSEQGAVPMTSTPEQFGSFIKDETSKWAKLVKFSGARID